MTLSRNLYQYFCELGAEVLVKRNDELTLAEIASLAPEKIVISPGPCTPDESGISLDVIRRYAGKPAARRVSGSSGYRPVFGAAIVRAAQVMHGKTSLIEHNGEGVLRVKQPAHRYALPFISYRPANSSRGFYRYRPQRQR